MSTAGRRPWPRRKCRTCETHRPVHPDTGTCGPCRQTNGPVTAEDAALMLELAQQDRLEADLRAYAAARAAKHPWMSIHEAMDHLNVDRNTLLRLAYQGTIRTRIHRARRQFAAEDVYNYELHRRTE